MRKASWARTTVSISEDRKVLSICAPKTSYCLCKIVAGVDDRTWEYHLRAGDYSRWFRDKIKDFELASEVADIEMDEAVFPSASRCRVKETTDQRYTDAA